MGGRQGLWRLDPKTKVLKLYAHDPKVPGSISEGIAFSLYESRDGFLWIGTKKGELNRMDPKTGIFTRFGHDPDSENPDSMIRGPISVLKEDSKGNLWVGRFGGITSMKIVFPTGINKHY